MAKAKKSHSQMDATSKSFAQNLDQRREKAMKKREAWNRTGLGLEEYNGSRGGHRR